MHFICGKISFPLVYGATVEEIAARKSVMVCELSIFDSIVTKSFHQSDAARNPV